MIERYRRFLRAVAVSRLGRAGVVLTTASFVTFLLMEAARLTGLVTNAYVGLIVFLALPTLFVIGLILIPIAFVRECRRRGLTTRELLEGRFPDSELEEARAGAPVLRTVAILTLINVLFLGIASTQMLHFMDQPRFCGTACHSVMHPEWITYQQSPHARVACVECHVGEGVGALVNSKLNGAWQMISAAFNLYERPIPTPVHQLRPAQETCEKCHWPDKFYGSRLVTRVTYGDDVASTPSYTTLNLKIDPGAGGDTGVHWHVAEVNQVRYASVDDERETMIWVEVTRPDGTVDRYRNTRLEHGAAEHDADVARVMDCVDCHNRATHIYEDPEEAVDVRLRLGDIDRSLPYIRREAVDALTAGYPSEPAAMTGIRNALEGFYRRLDGERPVRLADVEQAIEVLREIYARNVHHRMNVMWGAYPSHLGHRDSPGCFRCHSRDLRTEDGRHVDDGCTLCHSILADGSDEPFAYLAPSVEGDPERALHEALRQEFLGSYVRRESAAGTEDSDRGRGRSQRPRQ